jgi:hypothetical protein
VQSRAPAGDSKRTFPHLNKCGDGENLKRRSASRYRAHTFRHTTHVIAWNAAQIRRRCTVRSKESPEAHNRADGGRPPVQDSSIATKVFWKIRQSAWSRATCPALRLTDCCLSRQLLESLKPCRSCGLRRKPPVMWMPESRPGPGLDNPERRAHGEQTV